LDIPASVSVCSRHWPYAAADAAQRQSKRLAIQADGYMLIVPKTHHTTSCWGVCDSAWLLLVTQSRDTRKQQHSHNTTIHGIYRDKPYHTMPYHTIQVDECSCSHQHHPACSQARKAAGSTQGVCCDGLGSGSALQWCIWSRQLGTSLSFIGSAWV